MATLVCAVMMFTSIFATGCGNKKNNNEENASNTNSARAVVTLNMFMMTSDKTDPKAATAVQMKINEITLPKYKTRVKINYLTEDKYWPAIEAMEKKIEDKKAKEEKAAEKKKETIKKATTTKKTTATTKKKKTTKKTTAEDKASEFSKLIDKTFNSKDIKIKDPQIDIYMVPSAEKFYALVKDEKLAPIDTYLNYEDKIIKEYTYPTLFAATNVEKKSWGVPVNTNAGGEYEYFVFNKNLLDKYGYKAEDLTQLRDLGAFLGDVKAGEPGVVPLTKVTTLSGYEFFGGEEGGAIGTYKPDTSAIWSSELYPIFSDRKYFYRHCIAVEEFRKKGYVPSSYTAGTPFAVDIRTSNTRPKDSWTENGVNYVSYIYKLPRVKAANILKNVFVVSALSNDVERSMELITLFNTNAELANLMQYGIKGVNYLYDTETSTVSMVNDSYTMNNDYTGNRYIKYTLKGEEGYNEAAKAANVDIVESAFFAFNPELEQADLDYLKNVNAISKKYYNMIINGQGSVDSIFNTAEAELNALGIADFIKTKIAAPYATYAGAAGPSQVYPPIVLDRLQKLYEQGVNTDAPPKQKSPMDTGKASAKTETPAASGTTTTTTTTPAKAAS